MGESKKKRKMDTRYITLPLDVLVQILFYCIHDRVLPLWVVRCLSKELSKRLDDPTLWKPSYPHWHWSKESVHQDLIFMAKQRTSINAVIISMEPDHISRLLECAQNMRVVSVVVTVEDKWISLTGIREWMYLNSKVSTGYFSKPKKLCFYIGTESMIEMLRTMQRANCNRLMIEKGCIKMLADTVHARSYQYTKAVNDYGIIFDGSNDILRLDIERLLGQDSATLESLDRSEKGKIHLVNENWNFRMYLSHKGIEKELMKIRSSCTLQFHRTIHRRAFSEMLRFKKEEDQAKLKILYRADLMVFGLCLDFGTMQVYKTIY